MKINIRNNKSFIIIILSSIIFISGLTYLPALIRHNPLPNASKIERIVYNYQVFFKHIEIKGNIPPEDFQSFLSLFDDAHRDFWPAKWQGAGACIIYLKNGGKIEMDLYLTAYVPNTNESSAMKIKGKYYRVATDDIFLNFFNKYKKEL